MSFRKYMRAESVQVADAEERSRIRRLLAKTGKTSVRELTADERKLLK